MTQDSTHIVITSIFLPTEAIILYSDIANCKLIVAGDKKTPALWEHKNVDYLSLSSQRKIGSCLRKLLPINHYSRKMMGYLHAIGQNATCIIDTDDDNYPYEDYAFPELEASYCSIPDNKGFINIYQLFTHENIWPRGLPLHLIRTQFDLEPDLEMKPAKVGVWQGLVDADPDVDAIYRLTSDKPCYFKAREPVVLGFNTISPFNSQNTMFRKELFPLLYLPAHVTFRFTDILRGLVAQPIMWLQGYHLGFTRATVFQKRNPHNYYKDFISEIPVFQYAEDIIDITIGAIHQNNSISDNLMTAYQALYRKAIVKKIELKVLEAWLQELQHLAVG